MRKLALVVVVLCALALGLWLALRAPRAGAVAAGSPVESAQPNPPALPLAPLPTEESTRTAAEDPPAPAPESEALAAEPDTLEAEVEAGTFLFHGLVLDGVTEQPLEGVRALITGGKGVARPAERGEWVIEAEAHSDARGRFALPVHSAIELGLAYLVADGYGVLPFVYDSVHDASERAERLELLPAAELELVLRDGRAHPLAALTVELHCPGEGKANGHAAMFGADYAAWSAESDAEGRAPFTDLPAERLLVWSVSAGPGAEPRSDRVALGAGERRVVTVVLGAGARLSGRVRDQDGVLVPGLELWLVRPSEEPLLRRGRARVAVCTSDELGRFELGELPYEPLALGPSPEQAEFVSRVVPVLVERAEDALELTVTRGLAIEGRVVGLPEKDAGRGRVNACPSEGKGSISAELEPDGRFRIAPLEPGEYLVHFWGRDGPSEVVRAAAGASGVELRFLDERVIPIHVSGTDGEFEISVHDLERDTVSMTSEEPPLFEWKFALGAFTVLATTPDGRLAFLPRVEIRADAPNELELAFDEPARVTFVHRATGGVRALRLRVDGEAFPLPPLSSAAREGLLAGAAETLQVPAGRLRAELVEQGRVVAVEECSLLPGERRRIELAPR